MKNIKNLVILLISGMAILSCSSDDKIIDFIFDNTERGAILRTLNSTNTFNFYDPNDVRFTFDVSIEIQSDKSAVPSELRLFLSFKDNTDDGVDNSKSEVLLNSFDAASLPTSDNGFPQYTLPTQTLTDALNIVGLSSGDYFGLDDFIYRFELETEDGRIFSDAVGGTVSGGSFFTSPFSYQVKIKCVPIIAIPGVYTIKMADSYGDGWQTDDPSGGSGITLTLDDTTVLEFGMCSPYVDSDYECTPGVVAAETTVEIPVGTVTAVWFFPGDFYGEISFKIIAPNGDTAIEFGTGEASAGELFLNICL